MTATLSLRAPTWDRICGFLDRATPETPCLVVDLPTVRERYRALRAALPGVEIFYAVKANPMPQIIALLSAEGAAFDVASTRELDECLSIGVPGAAVSYGNPVKKPRDVRYAHQCGVRQFVTDNEPDVRVLAENAPGARVLVRILVSDAGSACGFGGKFGCTTDMAADLLRLAHRLGLEAAGVALHTGSQQLDPAAWDPAVAAAARIFTRLRAEGIASTTLDLGGGLPVGYRDPPPASWADYGTAINAAVTRHFGANRPRLIVEPGRAIVAEAGVIRSEVVQVSRKSYSDRHRWVYLDIGRYNGLAETEGEAIAYQIRTSRDGGPVGPVILAGPTCDGDDILYRSTRYELPLDLGTGDHVDLLAAGAYTTTYSALGFNGFPPLATYFLR